MEITWDAFIDSLANDPLPVARKNATPKSYPKPAYKPLPVANAPRVAKPVRTMQDRAAEFRAQHVDVVSRIEGACDWSEFAMSLMESLRRYGSWTDNQLRAASSMAAKIAAREEQRAAARTTAKADLAPIRAMFEAASENGYKKPVYRAEGLDLRACLMLRWRPVP